jgi:hypothetical protein
MFALEQDDIIRTNSQPIRVIADKVEVIWIEI